MSRVACRAYGAGVWNGVEFREQEVDGLMVGVAVVEGEALDWFRARPTAFTIEEPEAVNEATDEAAEETKVKKRK